jgi:hypothetical protein
MRRRSYGGSQPRKVKLAYIDNADVSGRPPALTRPAGIYRRGLYLARRHGLKIGGRELAKCNMAVLSNMAVLGEKALKASVDRFLKTVSFTARSEVEKAIRAAIASGKIEGHETVTAAVALSSEKIGLNITIYSKIEL